MSRTNAVPPAVVASANFNVGGLGAFIVNVINWQPFNILKKAPKQQPQRRVAPPPSDCQLAVKGFARCLFVEELTSFSNGPLPPSQDRCQIILNQTHFKSSFNL